MVSFKAKFRVLQELFAKNRRGEAFGPPSGARVNRGEVPIMDFEFFKIYSQTTFIFIFYVSFMTHILRRQALKFL